AMTAKAKEMGLFGLETRTRVGQVGDSLDVRIPKRVAEFLKITKGTEVWLHPEKNKLIVEI
ncbi:AbrB/MazE/SpoVT family DNA-binding domain-containing protein, partial [Candidatus Woesearchaeota archaeon]|nr:AbrB/MazE/SpoVT family DNA-binding domain-containing protein [Candidatus Woesearchaeota archaeon]